MTRYLLGRRMGKRPANLQVVDKPPAFYKPKDRKQSEHVTWPGTNYAWHPKRGTLHEWRDDDALVIARIFPEEYAVNLAFHEGRVVLAEHALVEARRERQEFLDSIAPRAKPVRLAEARREREAQLAEQRAKKESP